MEKNEDLPMYEEYRLVWTDLTETKHQLSKLSTLNQKLSPERFQAFGDELTQKVSKLQPNLDDLHTKLNLTIKSEKEKIVKLKNKINDHEKHIQDSQVLFENNLINDLQFKKEQKINQKEHDKFSRTIIEKKQFIEKIEMMLQHPNPDDEAKAISEKEAIEKAKQDEIKNAEKEEVKRIEKEKFDVALQVSRKIKKEKEKMQLEIDKIRQQNEQLNELKQKTKQELLTANLKIKKIEKENSFLKSDLNLAIKKAKKYQERLVAFRTKQMEFSIPCGDQSCKGKIKYDGICGICQRNFKQAKLLDDYKNKYDKFENIYKTLIVLEFLVSIIDYNNFFLTFFILASFTTMIWYYIKTKIKIKILDIDEDKTERLEKDKDAIERLETEIDALKREK